MVYWCTCLMRDDKEGRKKQARSNKQHNTPKTITFPKKNELPRVGLVHLSSVLHVHVCTCIYMHVVLHVCTCCSDDVVTCGFPDTAFKRQLMGSDYSSCSEYDDMEKHYRTPRHT